MFSETFLGIYVVALSTLFFLSHIRWLDFSKVFAYKKFFLLWIALLFSLVFSSLFTHSIPLTINQLVFYFFSFIVFSFFLLIKEKKLERDTLFINLFLVMFVLNLMSLAFLFFPSFSELIPGMNLLYSSYGHNHIGAISIIFIPVAFFYLIKFWQKKEKQSFLLMFGLLTLFIVNLLASFGRVVIFIGFLEILLLGLMNYKKFISQKRIFQYFYSCFVFLFVLVLSIKLFISLLFFFKSDFSCRLPLFSSYEEKVCKDLNQEARIHYWQRALSSIKENWKVGYGPGAYSLINSKYKDIPGGNSAYAHDAYLQVFAENGIFFFLIFSWLIWMSWFLSARAALFDQSLKKVLTGQNNFSLTQALFIGISAIYIDVLFDFDWSFLGVFMMTLVFMAMIFRYHNSENVIKISKKDAIFLVIIKISFILISSILILLSLLSIGVESLIYLGKTNQAVRFFPYFQIHMKLFLNDESLDEESMKVLDRVYINHSSYYSYGDQEKVLTTYRDQVIKIDPWYYYSYNNLDNLYDTQPQLVEKELVKVKALYDRSIKKGDQGGYLINNDLAKLSSRIGDEYLKNRNIEKAAYFYLIAFDLHNWFLNDTVPAFVYFPLSYEEKEKLREYLDEIDVKFYAKNRVPVAKSYFPFADQYLLKNDVENFVDTIKKIEEIAPWVKEDYLLENQSIIQENIDHLIIQDNLEEAEKLLKILSSLKYSYWAKTQLGNFYLLQNKDSLALQSFYDCAEKWSDGEEIDLHGDCYYGAKSVEEGWMNRNRYHEVSKIIRGESVWEDFIN